MAAEKETQQEDELSTFHPLQTSDDTFQAGENGSPIRQSRQPGFPMNTAIGWILQGGVMISSVVICAGVVLWLAHSGQHASQQFLVFPHTLSEVGSGLLALHSQAVIALGLLLLLATPVVRVAASIVAFGLEHDRRFVLITTIVLVVLVLSFLLGRGAA